MNVIDAIKQRRSIRKYSDKPVSDAIVKELIDAARLAPSGNNAQPWKFYVIKSDAVKKKLDDNNVFAQKFVCKSPVLIACSGDPEAYPKQKIMDDFDDSLPARALRDVSIASAHIDLRVTELGLGACYVGWMDKPKLKKLINIPERCVAPFVLTIGHPAENPAAHPRKRINEIMEMVK